MPPDRRNHRLGLLATAVSLRATSWASAQTVFNWNAPAAGNGNFSVGPLWTPAGGPPEAGEEARFNSANSDYTVAFTTDPTISAPASATITSPQGV